MIRLLAKLEYGVALFCYRQGLRSQSLGYHYLSAVLSNQSRSEYKHYVILAQAAGLFPIWGYSTIVKDWSELPIFGAAADGISHRYCTTRFLFGNRSAHELDPDNAVAMMAVLEQIQTFTYRILGLWIWELRSISEDEAQHARLLLRFASTKLVIKWWLKCAIATPLICFDLLTSPDLR